MKTLMRSIHYKYPILSIGLGIALFITAIVFLIRAIHPIEFAIDDDDGAAIRAAVARRPGSENQVLRHGRTPLCYACYHGKRNAAEALLDCGADPNLAIGSADGKADTDLFRPLHFAASHGRDSCVRLLLQRGADKSARSKLGETPLDIAIRKGHQGAAAILKE